MLFVSRFILEREYAPDYVVWIRYNPDSFTVGNALRPKFVSTQNRLARLVSELQTFEPQTEMSIIYMYYNVDADQVLRISMDEQYSVEIKQKIAKVIVS